MPYLLAAVFIVHSVASPAPLVSHRRQAGGAQTAVTACSLLTKDLIASHSPASKESLKLMLMLPPEEGKSGSGTICSTGGVTMQLDPFPVASFDKLFGKGTSVAGVGERAYFHENRTYFAELAVISGNRMLTFQMGVPNGSTPASIQPNVVALAKAVVAKLK